MRRYSTPSAGFSDLVSPLRISVPSFTSTLMSSLFIPGSSARIRYESLLSSTSTAGCHFDTLGRPKLSSNRSLNTERKLPKPVNASHLTNSIVVTFYAKKLSDVCPAVNYLTDLNSVLTHRRLNWVTKKGIRMNTKDRGDDCGKDQREILRMGQTARMPVPAPPAGSSDCQFHIYDDPAKFPPRQNPPYEAIESATFGEAQKMHQAIGFARGVIVQ